jgi:hypothetical protein
MEKVVDMTNMIGDGTCWPLSYEIFTKVGWTTGY